MVFSSFSFLVLFLPVFLIVYFIVPSKSINIRNFVLMIFSLFFYAWGEPLWILALLFSGLLDYFIGLNMDRCRGKRSAKALLLLSMCGNLGLLLVFKYGAFFLNIVGIAVSYEISLPIGISFYTFQTMSYTIDLYRGKIKTQKNPVAFFAYVAMFPQLVAGPIVRYSTIEDRLTHRRVTVRGFSEGVGRFTAGLGKKVILANHAGKIAAAILTLQPHNVSTTGVWLGTLMFMFQIYFDFSGYSDMAIGIGKMLGFDFDENFNYPYTCKSITDFWRRWHISLSTFFRDYVYIPLGGNRRHAIFNILVVWLLTGLWHGASYNFILWGLYFGIILIIEKYALKGLLQKIPSVFSRLYSLIIVLFGWLIFYFTDMDNLLAFSSIFFGGGEHFTDYRSTEIFFENLWILPVLAVFSTGLPMKLFNRIKNRIPISEPVVNFSVMCASFIVLIGQTYNPFLYFRF